MPMKKEEVSPEEQAELDQLSTDELRYQIWGSRGHRYKILLQELMRRRASDEKRYDGLVKKYLKMDKFELKRELCYVRGVERKACMTAYAHKKYPGH